VTDWFNRFAHQISKMTGSAWAFLVALAACLIWLASGPFLGWSVEWNFFANTTTTVITFLMVFLIQNTQNRDTLAMHIKLDELIHSIETADDEIIRAEDETDQELAELKRKYEGLLDEHAALKSRVDQSTAAG
jgi:low affinity Fe/Cu permease